MELDGLVLYARRLLEQLQEEPGDSDPTANEAVLPPDEGVAGLVAALEALVAADGCLRQQVAAHAASGRSRAWEQRYRALFEALPDACFLTDVAGVVRETNHATNGLLGYARKYCLGKPVGAFFAQETAGRIRNTLAQAATLPDGKVLTWKGHGKPQRRGGTPPVVVRVSAIRDQDGVLAGFSWLVRDVSAEHQLAERYRTLVAEQDARLRARTAELEAVVKVQSALIEQQRADRVAEAGE